MLSIVQAILYAIRKARQQEAANSIHTNKKPAYPQRADGTRGLAVLACRAGFPERIIHRDQCHDIADIGFGIIRQGKSGFRAFDRNLQLIIPFQDIVEEVHCSFGTGLEQVTAKFFLFVTANTRDFIKLFFH